MALIVLVVGHTKALVAHTMVLEADIQVVLYWEQHKQG